MNTRKKREDFFDDMKNYKDRKYMRICLYLVLFAVLFLVTGTIIRCLYVAKVIISKWAILAFVILLLFALYLSALGLCVLIAKNNEEFAAGKFSGGIRNIVFLFIIATVIIIMLIIFLPEEYQSYMPSLIAATVAILAAALAIMGVHYTETKKREARTYKNTLIFIHERATDAAQEYKLEREIDCKYTSLCLKNISDNFGWFCGIYRIDKCNIYQVGKDITYFPIAPNLSYTIKNIGYQETRDQLILVYKDIEDVHYYIHFRVISARKIEIIKTDTCDIGFIHMRLKETAQMQDKSRIKSA